MTREERRGTMAGRIAFARDQNETYRKDQVALADCVGVARQTISAWETGRFEPEGDRLDRLAECLGVSREWLLVGDVGAGHFVVRDGGSVEYDPNPDPEGTPAEQLMAYLGVKVGMRRLAGELTSKDLVAVAYTLARAEGFSAEEFRKLDVWRDQILEEERRGPI